MGKIKRNDQGIDPSAIQWSDESIPAETFISQYDLPQIVKINSGHYGNFGSGTDVDVNQPFLLHTARDCEKVLAENVVWDIHREKYIETGVQIIIPTNYQGWFSVGSETSTKKVESWKTARDIPLKTTKSILSAKPVTCYSLSERTSSGEKLYFKRDYVEGEVFDVGDLFIERTTTTVPTCCMTWLIGGGTTKETIEEVEYILSNDSNNSDILLPIIAKGCFYKVNRMKKEKFSLDPEAVYKIRDVIDGTDFPSFVNLIYGKAPKSLDQFSGTVRLEEVYKEGTVVACSLGSNKFRLLEFPMDSGIQFIPAKNSRELLNHNFVQDALEYCLDNVMPYIVSLKVIQNFFSGKSSVQGESDMAPLRQAPVPVENGFDSNIGMDNNNFEVCTHSSNEFSDDESDARSGESHYETIPCDRPRDKNKEFERYTFSHNHDRETLSVDGLLPRRTAKTMSDEDEYLVPANMRKQSIYSNVENEFMHRNTSHSSFQHRNGAICPANSIAEDDHISRQPFMLQRLPSGGQERMDRFLQDSLEELNRIRSSCSEFDETDLRLDQSDHKTKEVTNSEHSQNANDDSSHMKATLDAFLEEIFDCNNLEKGEVSANIEHLVKQKEQFQSVNYSHEQNDHNTEKVHNFKSLSAVDLLDNDNDNSPYASNSVCSADANMQATCVDIKDLELHHKTLENENTSSSSRSASSIYRQMKYANYGRAESYHPESPYPRTDSGIFVSPRYSLSESGYNKGIYQAMSEVSWTPPDDISTLSVEEVSLSMIYIGIKQKAVDLFFDQQIDGQQLLDMDENLLKEGFPELNSLERKKVLDFIKGWRPKKLT